MGGSGGWSQAESQGAACSQAWGLGGGLDSGLGVGMGCSQAWVWGGGWGGHHSAGEQELQPATCRGRLATRAQETRSTSRQGGRGGNRWALPPPAPGCLGGALTPRGAAGVPGLPGRSAAHARPSGHRVGRTGGRARGLPCAHLRTEGGVKDRGLLRTAQVLLGPPDGRPPSPGAPALPSAPPRGPSCPALPVQSEA